jgi:oligopeptide/dipeptide ABC transporter ATP-binding protein
MVGRLLEIENLSIRFATDEGPVTPVHGVSFGLDTGRTLGIVGESGSGKSVTTKAIIRLLPGSATILPGSRIRYRMRSGEMVDVETLSPNARALRRMRGGEIGMIFQEPMASFSPVYTIGNQMIEMIRIHKPLNRRQARELAVEMLAKVGLSNPGHRVDQYPHELSGGMRQRAMIAMALSVGPSLLIADEPTTALDVTIQAQVLDLMRSLRDELGMAIIFISHDLGVINQIADDVVVMYLGTVVETGPVRQVIGNPQHPYTRGLLQSIPRIDTLNAPLIPVPGDIPSPSERPAGCPFHTRCPIMRAGECDRVAPAAHEVSPGHSVSCHAVQAERIVA